MYNIVTWKRLDSLTVNKINTLRKIKLRPVRCHKKKKYDWNDINRHMNEVTFKYGKQHVKPCLIFTVILSMKKY